MKRNNYILCLVCLVAMVCFSRVAIGQTVTFSNTHIETNAKTSDGKSALKVHYDANVKGCYGHTIKIGLSITAGNGTHIVDSEENKGVGFTTQEIHYDNSNLSDRSIIVPYSKFKVYSGTNTYYYQLFAVDKVTGDYLGESYLTAFDMVGKSNSNSNSNSGNKTNKSTQSASFSDLRVSKTTNNKGEEAVKYFFDITLEGCRGRIVNVNLNFVDGNGNYLYGKDGKKLYWTKTFNKIDSDKVKYTDQTFLIALNALQDPYGQSYYYQLTAHDKTSGNQLGKSEKKSLYWGEVAVVSGERMVTENSKDGSQLSYVLYYRLTYSLPKASNLRFVYGICDDPHCSKPHKDKNGNAVVQEYIWKNEEKRTCSYLDIKMGFDHDEINAQPGTHVYYLSITVLDERTGKILCQTGPWKFYANGDGSRVKASDTPKDDSYNNEDSYKLIEDFDSWEEYERYMEDLERQYMEKRKARVKDK